MQDIVEQIIYYQSGGTYTPVSAGKGDLALSTSSQNGSKDSLHLRDSGAFALGMLKGIGTATANLARKSTKQSNVGGISEAPLTLDGQTLPMTVTPGKVEDQIKGMDDETASMFTQHWILSREWYTEKQVDELSMQREPKLDNEGHVLGRPPSNEKLVSSSISTASASTGMTLFDRDRESNRDSYASGYRDRDSYVSGYRDSTASDVSFAETMEMAGGDFGPRKSTMQKVFGVFGISGRDSVASDVIPEQYGEDDRRKERRRSGSDLTETAPPATTSGQRNSTGSGMQRELMAQLGQQAKSVAERRGTTNSETVSMDLSSDSSMAGSSFHSPANSRPQSAVSTPNHASLEDVGPAPVPLPVRSRASRSPERNSDVPERPFSYLATQAVEGSSAPGGGIRRAYSGEASSPVSAPTGNKQPPFGVRFEESEGIAEEEPVKTHVRTQSAGRAGTSALPPGAFGYTMGSASSASASAVDKSALARRATASAGLSSPTMRERPQSVAVLGTQVSKSSGDSSASASGKAGPGSSNEPTAVDNKRKPVKGGFALPGMAPTGPP